MSNNTIHNLTKLSTSLDYFVVGHVTADLTEEGVCLGGTASFSGLTAKALGFKTGILSSFAEDLDIKKLDNLEVFKKTSDQTTTFVNRSKNGAERIQFLYQTAEQLTKKDLPKFDQPPAILHLGPVADEVNPDILSCFPNSLRCLTPQGWFRGKNAENQVELQPWEDCERFFSMSHIAVISHEDVQRDEAQIALMANAIPVLVVTENNKGARVYWNNDARFIKAPEVKYVNDTGAGDIFASAFFYRYFFTKDPWEAGRFAVLLASWSVTRKYLESIPTNEEIKRAKMELLNH